MRQETMQPLDGVWVNGTWQRGAGTLIDVIDPARAEVFAQVGSADADTVAAAVRAARRALPAWSALPARQRGELLRAVARNVEAARERLIALQMRNNGKPRHEAEFDVGDVIATFDYYAGCCASGTGLAPRAVELPDDRFEAKLRLEPVGVVGLIVPWNFPMVTTAWKLAPALAAGCTVVLKPSELTPLAEIELTKIVQASGLPDGVLNLVCGGAEVGAALVAQPAVAKISFTGSTQVGQAVMRTAAARMTRVSLELGGKSALIVLDDADLDQAVELALGGAYFNAGQMCSATSRILVARSRYPEFVERLKAGAEALVPGRDIGPLISAKQYQRVQNHVRQGAEDGGLLLAGGGTPATLAPGYFIAPALFVDLPATSALWHEEIFGPVACVRAFDSDAEAVQFANDSPYGLVASVVGTDMERAERLAAELEVGTVWVNSPQVIFPHTAWGGRKLSGLGRELGPWGLAAFQEVKHVIRAAR